MDLSLRARRFRRLLGRRDVLVVRDAAALWADRIRESVQHGLAAELVVQRVAVHAEFLRSLRHIAAAGGHRGDDVLALECFDSLLERDAVSDQFTDDRVQTVVNTYHSI